MPCYHPIVAYQPRDGGPLIFKSAAALNADADQIEIACGQCRGCRKKRAREWAIRCDLEARTHQHNSFITLTYADEHLPKNQSLDHRDWQTFAKRLRKAVAKEVKRGRPKSEAGILQKQGKTWCLPSAPQGDGRGSGRRKTNAFLWDEREISTAQESRRKKRAARHLQIKYFMCGEYGEKNGRPHYHAILFGIAFADRTPRVKRGNYWTYDSETLARLWGKGRVELGESASYDAGRYVGEYILKKQLGDGKNYYEYITEEGEIRKRKKEYCAMSRRPGVGSGYLHKHGEYLVHGWTINAKGHKGPLPRYFEKWFTKHNPDRMEEIKWLKQQLAMAQIEHHTPERLAVQEKVDRARQAHRTTNRQGPK